MEDNPFNGLKDILEIRDSLKNAATPISESDFVKYVLPQVVAYVKDPSKAELSVWMAYSNAITRPLDVLDGSGKVLFRAPSPLSRALNPSTADMSEPTMTELVGRAARKRSTSANVADTYLVETVTHRIGDNVIMEMPSDDVEQWRSIFERYGYLKPNAAQSKRVKANTPTVTFSEDDDEPIDF